MAKESDPGERRFNRSLKICSQEHSNNQTTDQRSLALLLVDLLSKRQYVQQPALQYCERFGPAKQSSLKKDFFRDDSTPPITPPGDDG